jgi:ATP-binding protein involved in chromosome partitioning
VTLNMVKDLAIDGDSVSLTIELTTPACPLKDEIERNTRAALAGIGAGQIEITWGSMVRRAAPRQGEQMLKDVKNVIAVASGKGGVGKSTVSVNVAGRACPGRGEGRPDRRRYHRPRTSR